MLKIVELIWIWVVLKVMVVVKLVFMFIDRFFRLLWVVIFVVRVKCGVGVLLIGGMYIRLEIGRL